MKNRSLSIAATHTIVALILALSAGLVYFNTLNSPFVFDDLRMITDNPTIRIQQWSLDGLINIFQLSGNRPIPVLSFAFNYFFDGYNTFGYHIVNIFIHALTGFLFYFFVTSTLKISSRLKADSYSSHNAAIPILAALTALLWLVHPVNTQSVTYTVQRMNSMSALFCMLSFNLYIEGRLHGAKTALFLYILSLLS